MVHRVVIAGLSAVAILTLAAGCAGVGETASGSDPAASVTVSDLAGKWSGTIGWVGAYQYEGESIITLQIREDGTFTAAVTPNRETNNYAPASSLSGTVVARGNRVTLRNSQGPWTWVTLVRSGTTLYGVASDPASEGNVMLKLDRDPSRRSG
jgi:hypothetical protein